tara:strand:+ start:210 stop:503 length:294 start_codon:yes stop_codon:yes gene_type:complete
MNKSEPRAFAKYSFFLLIKDIEMFASMAEKGVLFIVALLSFVQAWISIRYMMDATSDDSIGGIYKAEETKSDAIYTTVIVGFSFLLMAFIVFMGRKG